MKSRAPSKIFFMSKLKSFVTSTKRHLNKLKNADAIDATLLSCGYILGDVIGEGTYATVCKSRSQRLDRVVAIKIVNKATAPKRFLSRFLPREIDIIKRLRHPNILQYYQCIETTHRFCISMECAVNGCVLDLLMHHKIFDESLSRQFFRELIAALDYLHGYDVVHRDIKLENLLLDERFTVKLCDFGFSRCMSEPPSDNMRTLSETFCGSHAYASPEILKFQPYDPKLSDVWAAEVVLYTMVCGWFPYDDRCYKQLLLQVEAPLQFGDKPELSEQCKHLIRHMLAPLSDRYAVGQIVAHDWMLIDADAGGLDVKCYLDAMKVSGA